jgi:hypothetical protein
MGLERVQRHGREENKRLSLSSNIVNNISRRHRKGIRREVPYANSLRKGSLGLARKEEKVRSKVCLKKIAGR